MRVLQVCSFIDSKNGGAPISTLWSAVSLNDFGLNCEVLVCGEKNSNIENMKNGFGIKEIKGTRVYFLDSRRDSKWGKFPTIKNILKIKKLIESFDVLILNQVYNFQNVLIYLINLKVKKPYILAPHGSLTKYDQKNGKMRKKIFNILIFRRVISMANDIFVTSIQEKQQVLESFKVKRISIVGLGFPLSERSGRKKVKNSEPIFLFIGRFAKKKRIDLTLEAFSLFLKRGNLGKLMIVGSGEEQIEKSIHVIVNRLELDKNVEIRSWVDGKDKQELFEMADFFVLNSEDENFAVVVAESMYYGVPALVSRHVALSEIVERNKAGIVIDKLDKHEISAGMCRILKSDYSLMVTNAIKSSEELTWKVAGQRWRDEVIKHI